MLSCKSTLIVGLFSAIAVLLANAPLPGAETPVVERPNVRASLLTDAEAIAPGAEFWVGVRYRMAPGWHIYWKNYGESGIPTSIDWELPDGFEVEDLHWPTPRTYLMAGLMSYVYEDEVILMARVRAPESLTPGEKAKLRARSSWLVCEDICIPGDASFELELPVADTFRRDAATTADLEKQRLTWPRESELWRVRGEVAESAVTLLIEPRREGLPPLGELYFFCSAGAIEPARPQEAESFEDGSYRLVLQVAAYHRGPVAPLRGVLFAEYGWDPDDPFQGLRIEPLAEADQTLAGDADTPATAVEFGEAPTGLWRAVIFALIGGALLNLMPCVFPVLGLKIMGFVRQAGEDKAKVRRHGLVFTAGVLVSLWLLVGLLLALRAAGDLLGWGFQLQEPRFVAFVVILFTAFALNLMGVFEIGGRLIGTGAGLTAREGYSGSFFSGVLAVIVATPCTAPFMGVAIGFALASSTWITLLVFTLLGLGLALPYLVLSFTPKLIQSLPRPGVWMETFKQFMAFPLLAAALYFLWVYGLQAGVNATIYLLSTILAVGLGLWIYGRWGAPHRKPTVRRVGATIGIVLASFAAAAGIRGDLPDAITPDMESLAGIEAGQGPQTIEDYGVTWEIWSPERVEQLRAGGKTLYVDFTAAWCITCLANKRSVFSSSRVRDLFNDNDDLVLLRADWTNRDTVIARTLESYGRSGVPFNIIYPPSGAPVILPAALTPGIVLNAMEEVSSR